MFQLLNRIRLALHRQQCTYWFISFPKSGRTWTKTIVEIYLCRLYGLPPFTFEKFTPWIRQGAWQQIPRLFFVHPHCRETDPKATASFMRSLTRKKVIFMVRDPREVVYTYFFRLQKRMNDAKALTMDLPEFIRDDELGISRIIDFTNTWYCAGTQFQDYLCLRLEDVQENPIQEISRLLTFLDIPINSDLLSEVVNDTKDRTTRQIEDSSVLLSVEDRKYLDKAMSALDPQIGYQVDRPRVDHME